MNASSLYTISSTLRKEMSPLLNNWNKNVRFTLKTKMSGKKDRKAKKQQFSLVENIHQYLQNLSVMGVYKIKSYNLQLFTS